MARATKPTQKHNPKKTKPNKHAPVQKQKLSIAVGSCRRKDSEEWHQVGTNLRALHYCVVTRVIDGVLQRCANRAGTALPCGLHRKDFERQILSAMLLHPSDEFHKVPGVKHLTSKLVTSFKEAVDDGQDAKEELLKACTVWLVWRNSRDKANTKRQNKTANFTEEDVEARRVYMSQYQKDARWLNKESKEKGVYSGPVTQKGLETKALERAGSLTDTKKSEIFADHGMLAGTAPSDGSMTRASNEMTLGLNLGSMPYVAKSKEDSHVLEKKWLSNPNIPPEDCFLAIIIATNNNSRQIHKLNMAANGEFPKKEIKSLAARWCKGLELLRGGIRNELKTRNPNASLSFNIIGSAWRDNAMLPLEVLAALVTQFLGNDKTDCFWAFFEKLTNESMDIPNAMRDSILKGMFDVKAKTTCFYPFGELFFRLGLTGSGGAYKKLDFELLVKELDATKDPQRFCSLFLAAWYKCDGSISLKAIEWEVRNDPDMPHPRQDNVEYRDWLKCQCQTPTCQVGLMIYLLKFSFNVKWVHVSIHRNKKTRPDMGVARICVGSVLEQVKIAKTLGDKYAIDLKGWDIWHKDERMKALYDAHPQGKAYNQPCTSFRKYWEMMKSSSPGANEPLDQENYGHLKDGSPVVFLVNTNAADAEQEDAQDEEADAWHDDGDDQQEEENHSLISQLLEATSTLDREKAEEWIEKSGGTTLNDAVNWYFEQNALAKDNLAMGGNNGDWFEGCAELQTFSGDFKGAIEMAYELGRVLVVYLEDRSFASLNFNRDVLCHDSVKAQFEDLVVLWQAKHDSPEGELYASEHAVFQFPHIAFFHNTSESIVWQKDGWLHENPLTLDEFKECLECICVPNDSPQKYRGLQNLGNTCYMNAGLQLLFTREDYFESFASLWKAAAAMNPAVTVKINALPTMQCLMELPKELAMSESSPVDPTMVKFVLETMSAEFEGNGQKDAHEFIAHVVRSLHQEYLQAKKTIFLPMQPDVMFDSSKIPAEKDDFLFAIKVTLTCLKCGYHRSSVETFRELLLDIITPSSTETTQCCLGDSLAHYFQDETREYLCDSPMCQGGNHATQSKKFVKLPNALLIMVKRFSDDGGKNKSKMKIEKELSLMNYVELTDSPCNYEIQGMVHHLGNTRASGHYTADAIRLDEWVHFDDGKTGSITFNNIAGSKQETVYVKLYTLS